MKSLLLPEKILIVLLILINPFLILRIFYTEDIHDLIGVFIVIIILNSPLLLIFCEKQIRKIIFNKNFINTVIAISSTIMITGWIWLIYENWNGIKDFITSSSQVVLIVIFFLFSLISNILKSIIENIIPISLVLIVILLYKIYKKHK